MKWRKLLVFLAVSSTAFGCFALRWPVLTIFERFNGFGQFVGSSRFVDWPALFRPMRELDSAIWWIVGAMFVIDLLYLVWLRRQRGIRTYCTADSDQLALRHCLGVHDYEERLRQRHALLLARYRDPGLVQFLLNREVARAQQIDQWVAVDEPAESVATIGATAKQNNNEMAEQWSVDGTILRVVVNPVGA